MALPASVSSRRSAGHWTWLIVRVLTGVAMAAAVVLFLIDRTRPDLTERLRATALDSLAPALDLAAAPARGVGAAANWVERYLLAHARNAELEAENARLRLLAERTEALERDGATLRRLLRLSEPGVTVVTTARVVGTSDAALLDSAIVTAGAQSGLRTDMPVRDGYGVVGRVSLVGEHAARVLLASDIESRIPARILRTGETAIATGNGAGGIELQFLRPDADLVVGDRVVTSGHGRLFPPNIPVGVVIRIDASRPQLKPAAALDRLSYVVVMQPYQPFDTLLDAAQPPMP